MRGKTLRRQLDLTNEATGDSTVQTLDSNNDGSDRLQPRPGRDWLARAEREAMKAERLERARDEVHRREMLQVKVGRRVRMAASEQVHENTRQREAVRRIDGTRLRTDKRTKSFGTIERRLAQHKPLSAGTRSASFRRSKTRQEAMRDSIRDMTKTRDSHHYQVGILYSRANPRTADLEALRESVLRMRQRRAKQALPSFMPPTLPTATSANMADVVFKASKLQRAQGAEARTAERAPSLLPPISRRTAAKSQETTETREQELERLRRQSMAISALPLTMPHDAEFEPTSNEYIRRRLSQAPMAETTERTSPVQSAKAAAGTPSSRRDSEHGGGRGGILRSLFGTTSSGQQQGRRDSHEIDEGLTKSPDLKV